MSVIDIKKDPSTSTSMLPTLQTLKALVNDDLMRVNETILQFMQSDIPMIGQVASHVIAAGGKRLRPMLTLAAARLCGYEGGRHVHLAACVEFIHTATLLHDDVVDESKLRRGIESANEVWGNQASVLVGDFLFSRAFQLMVGDGSLEVLKILSDTSSLIAEGEVQQLTTTGNLATDQTTYRQVISLKTAALFAAAAEVGAVVAERSGAEQQVLKNFGFNLGMTFQLVDDILDYSAVQAELGKTIGDDFSEGKLTLPVILAYQQGDEKEKNFWRRTLEEGNRDKKDFKQALALIGKHDILAQVMKLAQEYGEKARAALSIFDASEEKQALLECVDFCVNRRF